MYPQQPYPGQYPPGAQPPYPQQPGAQPPYTPPGQPGAQPPYPPPGQPGAQPPFQPPGQPGYQTPGYPGPNPYGAQPPFAPPGPPTPQVRPEVRFRGHMKLDLQLPDVDCDQLALCNDLKGTVVFNEQTKTFQIVDLRGTIQIEGLECPITFTPQNATYREDDLSAGKFKEAIEKYNRESRIQTGSPQPSYPQPGMPPQPGYPMPPPGAQVQPGYAPPGPYRPYSMTRHAWNYYLRVYSDDPSQRVSPGKRKGWG